LGGGGVEPNVPLAKKRAFFFNKLTTELLKTEALICLKNRNGTFNEDLTGHCKDRVLSYVYNTTLKKNLDICEN
jgi:hypothetical protein